MRSSFLIILIAFCAACGNRNQQANDDTASTTDMAATDTVNSHGNWYKHYTGTIAGQAVAADIHKYNERITGTYYYQSQGKPIPIYFSTDTSKPGIYLVDETPEQPDAKSTAKWEVRIVSNTLSGKWKDDMGNDVYDILLKEAPSAYPLAAMHYADTIPYKQGMKEPAATMTNNLLLPGKDINKENANFISGIVSKFMGCDSLHKGKLDECMKAQSAEYATYYRKTVGELDDTMRNASFNNYFTGTDMYVAYNENDWIGFYMMSSEYTGGAHGNYGSSYINADMQSNKVWKLEDVVRVDSVRLQREIEKAARKRASMSDGEEIKSKYFVDRIMPNGNFLLTHKGITFNYTPYEIASYAEGEVLLFVPYASIKDLLTPAFKQRMKMQ
ncbi:MAG: DUF3298 domain-containing protein [Sphingobacteriales bacterium]|nr:MAG: DUF3298 domain-containing protein [Sphingobacteriales bacterium]